MMSKKVAKQHLSISASLADDYTSPAFDTEYKDNFCAQAIFTDNAGSYPVGTFYILESVDGTTYTQISSLTATCSGIASSVMIQGTNSASNFIKVKYARTSGDGVLDIWVSAKSI